ncbi:MAG TPA: TfoX/Sxy family protein [Feifaniaceae bacterium]|nr:TfoX/Sxy family protein [Feifaniaceae bacterium]
MAELTSLPNIAKAMEQQLDRADIHTAEELKAVGAREAWRRIFAFDPSACYSRLCALEGAVRGVRRHDLPEEVKAELKVFYRQYRPGK